MSHRTHCHDNLLLADFVYYQPQDCYLHILTGEVYAAHEIDCLFPPIPMLADEANEGPLQGS